MTRDKNGRKHAGGAKKTDIDLIALEKLCAMQCTDEEIAAWFGVATKTIERRRKTAAGAEAMERGKAKGRITVRRKLFALMEAGNVAAAIFLSKNLLGYRDVASTEHSGPNGGPIQISEIKVSFIAPASAAVPTP